MHDEPPPAYRQTFAALANALQGSLGHRLFTVSRLVPGAGAVERIFTTRADVYPLHGRKPVDQSEWTAQMARGECFIANQPEAFGEHFGDLDTIESMGLGAVINIPVHDGSRQVGSLNLLDAAGAYQGDVLPACHEAGQAAIQGFAEYEQFLVRSVPDSTLSKE